jgi:DNA transformation protein and related proteins
VSELIKLPNIGKVIDGQLEKVGISTIKQLKELGGEQAWLKLQKNDSSVCLDELYALEGAVQGIRWHSIDKQRKQELKEFFHSHSL